MMINKRLIREMEETKKYIGMQVLLQWAALLCNICLIFYISYALWQITEGNAKMLSLPIGASVFGTVIVIRYVLLKLEASYSHRSSEYVKKKLRHRIYEHLLKVGRSMKRLFLPLRFCRYRRKVWSSLKSILGNISHSYFTACLHR